jgi:hypothetical protein
MMRRLLNRVNRAVTSRLRFAILRWWADTQPKGQAPTCPNSAEVMELDKDDASKASRTGSTVLLRASEEETPMKLQLSGTALLSLIALAPELVPGQQTGHGNPNAPQGSGKPRGTTASIPADHFDLVKYFKDLASQERALAESYRRIARIYEEKTPPSDLDPASGRENEESIRAPRGN